MSATKNGATRCDTCGRLSRHPLGEYTKPDGSAGYIHGPFSGEPDDGSDACDECREKDLLRNTVTFDTAPHTPAAEPGEGEG